jgi:hypothetical protein
VSLFILDTCVIVDAKNMYPIRHYPRYWDWLINESKSGHLKIPQNQWDEINDSDLDNWKKDGKSSLCTPVAKDKLNLVITAYCENPTTAELLTCENDAALIATALALSGTVVTSELSATSKKGANQKIPDICTKLAVKCVVPTTYYREKKYGFFDK